MRNVQAQPVSGALLTALSALDAGAARAAFDSEQLGSDAVLAAYHQLQERQREGIVGSATVAAATGLSRQLLNLAASTAKARKVSSTPRGRVVVASPSGEGHLVDTEAVADALGAEGWLVDLMCGVAGDEDLGTFLAGRDVVAVVVVCATPDALPRAARALRDAHRNGMPVLLTGPAFGLGTDDLRTLRLGADGWAPDVASVVEVLDRWATARPVPNALGGLGDECLALGEALPSLREAAITGCSGTIERGLLSALLEHLEAAVLVDDGRVLLEFVRAELAARRTQGRDVGMLTSLVNEVSAALSEDMVRSRGFMQDAKRYLHQALRATTGGAPAAPPSRSPVSAPSAAKQPGTILRASAPQGAPGAEARVFSDLLMLAAMTCDAPTAMVSLLRDGRWSTLSHGAERGGDLGDPTLLEFVAARNEPIEVADLATHAVLSSSVLCRPPLDARWLLGVPLRSRDGGRLGVLCIVDRQRKELSRVQAKAVMAIVRQLEGHLEQLLRPADAAAIRPTLHLPERRTARRGSIDDGQQLLRSHEVASLFDVTERTVINWAASGKLPALRTIGGHLRFRSDDVASLLAGQPTAVRSG